MINTSKIVMLFVLLLSCSIPSLSQEPEIAKDKRIKMKNPVGQEFWLCFQRNFKEQNTNVESNDLDLELFITSDYDAKVKIEIDSLHFILDTLVLAETVVNIKLPSGAQVLGDEIISRQAVHVTANEPISIYCLNRRFQTTDTYLGLPNSVLGESYRAMCYIVAEGLTSQVAVVATEDNTVVDFIPSANTTKHPAKTQFSVTLKKGDVYQICAKYEPFSRCDLTGTLIKANKKIAVFSGHQCAYIPKDTIACNHLVEQMPPIKSWGKHFYLGLLDSRFRFTFRVLANEDSTKVFVESKLVKTLSAGDYYEGIAKGNLQVTTNKPVLVAQYSHGFRDGDYIGDPMMILISPTQQFLNKYRFATPIKGSWKHYINLVALTDELDNLLLDDKPIISTSFSRLGLSRYSIGCIQIPFGTHVIQGTKPFGLYSYGFGFKSGDRDDSFDSYGAMGGQAFIDYAAADDIQAPVVESQYKGKELKLIIRDDRIDDTGLKEIKLISSYNLETEIPRIDQGVPQISLNVKIIKPEASGRLVFKATDVSLNSAIYTLCYAFNAQEGGLTYSVSEGESEVCKVDPGIQIGAFGKINGNFHVADFARTGNVNAQGKFTEAFGLGGYFGFYVGRQIRPDMILSGRLSFENYAGILSAPDSSTPDGYNKHYWDTTTNTVKDIQFAKDLQLNSIFINLSFAVEYYPTENIYAIGGLSFPISLGDKIDLKTRIVTPDNKVFANNQREITDPVTSMGSLNSIRFSMFTGLGFSYPIKFKYIPFVETIYTYNVGNLINDGSWKLHQLAIHLGFKVII
jgi:hypothetical protein